MTPVLKQEKKLQLWKCFVALYGISIVFAVWGAKTVSWEIWIPIVGIIGTFINLKGFVFHECMYFPGWEISYEKKNSGIRIIIGSIQVPALIIFLLILRMITNGKW